MVFKICSSCNEKNPGRVRRCKKCDNIFAFKVKKKNNKDKKEKVSDWRELQKGDLIRVKGGPVFLDKGKSEIPMGYSGTFSVVNIDDNGIVAHGRDKYCGYCHIWMGKEKVSASGILKKPHKIYKLNIKA
jgi:ribosomal protein L40E